MQTAGVEPGSIIPARPIGALELAQVRGWLAAHPEWSRYRAANWRCVGQTQGRTRQDRRHVLQAPVKDVLVYPLRADFRKVLCP